jgi:PAS domain S-box-containing protein
MRANRFLHHGRPSIVLSHIDITQRVLSENQVRTMSLVARNTDNAVIVTDAKGEITWVNEGFTSMSGYSLEEVVGRKPGHFLRGSDTDLEEGRRISQALAAGERVEGEILNYAKSGKNYWLHFEISPVTDEYGEIVEFVALEQDITEEKRMLEALKEEKEATEAANNMLNLTRQALERTGIGEFWLSATDGRVIRVNDHACDYLGFSREEMLELSVSDFDINFPAERFQELSAPIKLEGWKRFESVHQTSEGRRIPVEVTALYLSRFADYGEMFIAFVSDITQRKEAEIELVLARDEAEHANRAKSTFLATMSHEIRTPLNGVVGTVDMLSHTGLDDSQLDLVETARDSAILLQGIIDDILDFSKIEAGRLELEQVPLDMESLVEKLGDNLQHQARGRNVELLVYCDPSLPQIEGDPVRLRQILFNLAGNAIKFSGGQEDKNGLVVIKVLLETLEDGRAAICMRVADNGIGMSPEVQAQLFSPFVQGEEDTTRRFGGTGLGLVITRRLVELMGGEIKVESAEGEGSTFSVYLSVKQTDTPVADITSLAGIKVVLVSRDEAGWILESYLEHAGAEVVFTEPEDVIKACHERFTSGSEKVVMLDTRNDKGGASALREMMRKEFPDIDLRFVVVERGGRRYSRVDGGDGLTLDLNAAHRSTLLNTVAAVVGRESPQQNTKTAEAIDMAQKPAVDNEHLILLVDDNETNRKVIGQQLHMLGYRAELAEDGVQALDMWREGDYSLILTDCHMPEMDGYQLTRAVRSEEPDDSHIPVLAITADALKGTAQKCADSGMDAYLTKPIQLSELRQAMEKWLPVPMEQEAVNMDAEAEEETQYAVLDPNALGKLLGTQERPSLAKYYRMFLDTDTRTVQQLQDAFQGNDLDTVWREAHKLKTSARTIGANELADCCMRIEKAGKAGDGQMVAQEMQRFPGLFDEVRKWIETYCISE